MAVVGRGSNLLVSDAGFRGLALRLVGRLTAISVRGSDLWCGGGASLPRAVRRAAAAGLEGLEWGASIPGTAGGAVAMNAGAHSGELAESLRWAVVCSADGRRRVEPADLALGYRSSAIGPGRGGRGGLRAASRRRRGDRRPARGVPRAPPPHPAPGRADLRERLHQPARRLGGAAARAGCKGLQIGGARFSPVHANFIEAARPAAPRRCWRSWPRGAAASPRRAAPPSSPRCATSTRSGDRPPAAPGAVSGDGPPPPAAGAPTPPSSRAAGGSRAPAAGSAGIALIGLGALAALALLWWLANGPMLAVGDVTVRGYDRPDRDALVAAIDEAASDGTMVSPPVDEIRDAAAAFPWVASVSVQRDWPRGWRWR